MSTSESGKLTRLLTYLDADPENQALLADALTQALDSKDDRADGLAQRVQALSAPNAPARFALSSWYMHQQDWPSATRLLTSLAAELPHNEATLYNLAQCLAFQGDYARCLQTLKSWVDQPSCAPYVQVLFARSAMHLSDYSAAQQALTSALQTAPTNPQALGLLSLLYKDTQQPDQAMRIATQLLDLAPQNTEANLVLGELALEDQNIPKARLLFEQVLSQRNSYRALRGNCMVQLINGEADKAAAGLNELVTSSAPLISDYHLLALAYLLLGNYEQALASLKAGEQFQPDNLETDLLVAIVNTLAKGLNEHNSISTDTLNNHPLGVALSSLEKSLTGEQNNAHELLTSIFAQQSPLGKTYGEVFSRLLKSQSSH